MPRFDLHRLRDGSGYLLNVEHHLHDALRTRVVVPLVPVDRAPQPTPRLNPVFEIEGERHVLFPQFLAAVPKRELGRAVGNLEPEREAITRALDLLLTGF